MEKRREECTSQDLLRVFRVVSQRCLHTCVSPAYTLAWGSVWGSAVVAPVRTSFVQHRSLVALFIPLKSAVSEPIPLHDNFVKRSTHLRQLRRPVSILRMGSACLWGNSFFLTLEITSSPFRSFLLWGACPVLGVLSADHQVCSLRLRVRIAFRCSARSKDEDGSISDTSVVSQKKEPRVPVNTCSISPLAPPRTPVYLSFVDRAFCTNCCPCMRASVCYLPCLLG